MSAFSDYYEDYVLDLLLNKTTYLGLSTADPDEDASGLAEPEGGAYARVTVPKSSWNDASGGSKSNSAAITFTRATDDWGTITHFAIFDALTGGNMLIYGALDASLDADSGEMPRFNIGDLIIALD